MTCVTLLSYFVILVLLFVWLSFCSSEFFIFYFCVCVCVLICSY
ncbi:unnamed protein product [Brassica oleracea]